MEISIIATLPKLTIEGGVFDLGDARLLKLPFDEILRLEKQENSGDYDKQRFRYTKNPPVFFEKKITVDDHVLQLPNDDFIYELKRVATPHINVCRWALYFYTGTPVLSPFLSSVYFDACTEANFKNHPKLKDDFENMGAYRAYGESGKEFTFINANPDIALAIKEQQAFSGFYSFLQSKWFVLEHEDLKNVFYALETLALPGINYSIRLVLLIGAIEAFLIPDKKTDLNQHFKKRFFALCNQKGAPDKAWMNLAYTIRSEIIHGSDNLDKPFQKLPYAPELFPERLLQACITGLCRFFQYADSRLDVKTQLRAFRNTLSLDATDAALQELLRTSDYEATHNITHQWKLKQAIT